MIKFRQFLASLWELLEVVLIAVLAVWLIRTFLIQPFLISGSSMEPNFSDGHYLLIDELSYRFRQPHRGEVIVFRSPTDDSTYFIKRIIGLPGEKVTIKGGEISVNGALLKESYLPGGRTVGDREISLGANQYFVLGDNRAYSFDSRNWGPLAADRIVGIVRLRLWPVNKVMAIEAPAY
ncbi:MAG: signal peptidase I [Parcubacteria group bacterium]|nr:signal peptidase I [Parcubacteria group bacterium]